ncbi:Phosphoserine phosphatase [Kingella potus]|uniref:Phosphoserine phosphatase n=1 Tax=Kingella potus TaxID=265175 RepID=A0A377R6X9_9NEIS|nr:phosphoserine phosphatase SerB [Kingella potus]UOP00032.1 phosphoserine phosphatase SerB [Kingella potus]STR03325.1 Phosphoserine phosphatase [Kingella potus]
MSDHLVLQHSDIARCDLSCLHALRPSENPFPDSVRRFAVNEGYALPPESAAVLDAQQIDYAVLPALPFSAFGLVVSDMDSTLITIECIDEIAAQAGLKDQVAAITERSMRGEADFRQSLYERVALLAGLPEAALQKVYDEVLQLSPGVPYLLSECKKHGVKFMLVSGGFTFFTDRLQTRLVLDYAFANVLASENGRLTGRLNGTLIDAQAKARLLREYRSRLGLAAEQVIAVGDGANDIPMLREAGFGTAYRAKPKTRQAARLRISHNGLEALRRWFL